MPGNIGLELMYQSVLPVLSEKSDVLVLFVHWKLIMNGWLCCGLTEKETDVSELLPGDWNQNHDVFELYYTREGKKYLLKGVRVDNQMIFSFARLEDNVTGSLALDVDADISDEYRTYKTAFVSLDTLSDNVESTLIEPFRTKQAAGSQAAEQSRKKLEQESARNPQAQRDPLRAREPPLRHDPLRVGEPRRPGRGYYDEWPFEENPFAVGGGDLDPLGMGRGGGMLMDPRHQRYPGSLGPPPGVPPNLPRGAVPPGARFDPFGPPRPDYIPPPPGAGTGGFGDPDPDHLPPPSGTEDMFM